MVLRLKFCGADVCALALVFALALGVFALSMGALAADGDGMLEVYQDGRLLRRISLKEDAVFEVEGAYHNTITVRDGAAAITSSDCPGGDCVRSGWTRGDKSIVCLPNRVELRAVYGRG